MPSEEEAQRIIEVYHTYHAEGDAKSPWSKHHAVHELMVDERTAALKRMLTDAGRMPLAGQRILEVGCGSGTVLGTLLKWGAQANNLYGVDLFAESIAAAQRSYPAMHFQCANAEQLDFDDAMFDLVLVFTVFSSILNHQMASNIAHEVERVLRPNGAVVWYDFRYDNPRNPNVQGMTKAAIRRLFPGFTSHLQTITLLPPLGRRLGPAAPKLYPLLARIPTLRTHYLGLLVP